MNHCLKALLGIVFAMYGASAMADDVEKLKALERAMATPTSSVEITKKPRTRAIVFDAQPAAPTAAPTPAAAPAQTGAAPSAGARDCSAVPPDAKLTGIDFTIQFKLGSAVIAPASEKVLSEISKVLSLSDKCVVVEGHTDAVGNAERNNALSRERANSVVNFISERNGVDRNRLVPVGKGSSEPLKNLDPRNPKNRRVVFKVVG